MGSIAWIFVSSPNAYGKTCFPKVTSFEGGAFGRWLGCEGGALVNGISAFIKESFLVPFCHVRTQREDGNLWTRDCVSPNTKSSLTLDFPISRTITGEYLLLISHPVYILLRHPKRMKTIRCSNDLSLALLILIAIPPRVLGLPWWLSSDEAVCQAGDAGSFFGSERSPEGGNGNRLQ